MSRHEIIPPSPTGASDVALEPLHNITPSRRRDGWTGERQRAFLEALSQGSSVAHACKLVGLSEQSAYAFRRAARGASFAIGWQAAVMLCGEVLADDLMDRARNGTRCVHFSADGSETHYQRHDNNLAFKMLNRADRLANRPGYEATHAAARLVAGDFEQYLEMIAQGAGPARAGLFLGTRLGARADGAAPAGADDLAPVRALARADHWLRTRTDLAEPIDTSDLDPARRDDWTAEQWRRAEAAGLFQPAPPAKVEEGENTKLPQHSHGATFEHPPVWWDDCAEDWRTHFPPPAGFTGDENGDYGGDDYSRELSPAERMVIEADVAADLEERRSAETAERDAYFEMSPPALPELATPEPPAPEPSAPAKRSAPARRTPRPAGSEDMSIMSRIKDAIMGRGGGIFGKDAPDPGQAPANTIASEPTATAPTPQNQAAASAEPVDVERVLTEKLAAKGNPDLNWRTSIVDLMKLLDLDSSLENRKELATELGYAGAKDGSAEMNIWLHNAVMLELVNNGAKVPEKLTG